MVKPQVIKRVDQVVKVVLVASLIGMVVAVTLVLTGCKTAGQTPTPMLTAHQAASPLPSWRIGMEPGCFATGEPVARECLEGGAPQCGTDIPPEQGVSPAPCWWVDPRSGDVWYAP